MNAIDIYRGKGVYGAVAIGKASVFRRQQTKVQRVIVDDPANELVRIAAGKQLAIAQLKAIYEKALKDVGEANAGIFEIHMMMLEDDDYNESIRNMIETQRVNAEFAVSVTSDYFAEMFAVMDDAYMQARAVDVRDISNRLIACLTGGSTVTEDRKSVV